MAPSGVAGPILADQLVNLLGCIVRKGITEDFNEVQPDVVFQPLKTGRPAISCCQHLLDSAAYIFGGIQQRAVQVEQIDGKRGDLSVYYPDHAGCGRSPSENPGARRPPSGRRTCCVWSSVSLDPEAGIGGRAC